MKSAARVLIWLAALAVIFYGGYRGARLVRARKQVADLSARNEDAADPVVVAVERVRLGTVRNSVQVTGEVRALRSVEVVPKAVGRLERMRLPDDTLIEEGTEVKRGRLVAVIEHSQLEAAVHSAEAALAVAGAARQTAMVNVADALREKERRVELRKRGSGTRQQLDQAATAYERAQAQRKQTEARIAQVEATLAQARVNLDEATIEAPFSGLVTRKHVDEGAFVGPSTPLFKLADISQVEITGGVAGRHYPDLLAGRTRAEIEVDACSDRRFEGTVSRLRPELDRVTRTVAVTIRVANPKRRLKPGMYARIRLILDERKDVPIVPDEALVATGDKTHVFVVDDGRVHVREVKIGLEEGAKNEVIEGLRAGDRVVVRGQQLLSEGMVVEPVEEEDAQ